MPKKAAGDNYKDPNEPEDDLFFNTDEDDDEEPVEPEDASKQLQEELQKQKELSEKLYQQNQQLLKKMNEDGKMQNQQQQQSNEPSFQLPPKPMDFDMQAAFGDPASESFAWRMEAERIQRAKENYELKKDITETVFNQLSLVERANKVRSMENELVQKRKLDDDKLQEFRKFLTDTPSLEMDELYDIYLKRTGQQPPIEPPPQRNNRQQYNGLPTFNDFSGPGREEVDDENTEFQKGLIGLTKTMKNKY